MPRKSSITKRAPKRSVKKTPLAKPKAPKAILTSSTKSGIEQTIRTKKISNGVIVTESTYNPKTGSFNDKETYYPKAPKITVE